MKTRKQLSVLTALALCVCLTLPGLALTLSQPEAALEADFGEEMTVLFGTSEDLNALAAEIGADIAAINVYETGEIAIPSYAAVKAYAEGAVCSWKSVGAAAEAYITVAGGKAVAVDLPAAAVNTTLTLSVSDGVNEATAAVPVVLCEKLFENPGLLDPGFEESVAFTATSDFVEPADWGLYEGNDWNISITPSDSTAATGMKSAHINNTASSLNAEALFSNIFPIESGKSYTISYKAKVVSSANGDYIYPYLRLYDANGSYLRAMNGPQFAKDTGGVFEEYSFTLTPADDAAYGRVVIFAWSDNPYEVFVDDIAAYADGTGENLVENGGFETLGSLRPCSDKVVQNVWGLYEGADWDIPITLSDSVSASGSKSVHINNTASSLGADAVMSNTFPVEGGKPYTVTYKVKVVSAANGDYIYPYLRVYGADGKVLRQYNGSQFPQDTGGKFAQYSFNITPADDVAYGRVIFFAWSDNPYEVYIDDVSIGWKADGYDAFIADLQTAAQTKIAASKALLTDITLDAVGASYILDAQAAQNGVNFIITSVTGDAADYVSADDYAVTVDALPDEEKTGVVNVSLSLDGVTDTAAIPLTIGSADADPAPVVQNAVYYETAASGIRFAANISAAKRAAADSYGFLVTRVSFLPEGNLSALTFDLVRPDASGKTAFISGNAFVKDPASGDVTTDVQTSVGADGSVVFDGIMTGIPAAYDDELLAARSFVKIGANTFYGNSVKVTVNSAKAGNTAD